MNLYKTLEDNRKNKKDYLTRQHKFYYTHEHLLEKINAFSYLVGKDDDFSVIRANILIRAIINKNEIEEAIKFAHKTSLETFGSLNTKYIKSFVEERMIDLPYLLDGEDKIYIPFFSRALNKIYREDYIKLLEIPYSHLAKDYNENIVDAFETYNLKLYESMFTHLVKIKDKDNVSALYDIDYQTIYFINDQGRLDAKICLFDKYIRRPNTNHIIKRITPIVDAYFNNDKDKLLEELLKNELISYYLIKKYKHRQEKLKNKKV